MGGVGGIAPKGQRRAEELDRLGGVDQRGDDVVGGVLADADLDRHRHVDDDEAELRRHPGWRFEVVDGGGVAVLPALDERGLGDARPRSSRGSWFLSIGRIDVEEVGGVALADVVGRAAGEARRRARRPGSSICSSEVLSSPSSSALASWC